MKETEEQLEKQAEEYRLKQARQLLKLLGYQEGPDGHWDKPVGTQKPQKKQQRYRIALPCPVGGEHDWAPASTFSEVERFELGAQPQDMICRKCWGLLSDYLVVIEK
ncbi:hypothetical protein M1367_03520 [Candidatus Marsarchaeota archaeon]|jgi:hypothetical protein|nr:hypothetical protein [Candidatus Marsarchaeota archaeon]